MKTCKKLKRLLLIFYLFSVLITVTGQTPANDKNWDIVNLKFVDEFNTPLDETIWWVWEYPYRPEWKDFCFTHDKVSIKNILPGQGLELKAEVDNLCPAKAISSGALETFATYLYGYYEASCYFPSTGKSYMPAFWLFASNCGALEPWYDEIDIEIHSMPDLQTPFEYTTNIFYKRGIDCTQSEELLRSYTPTPSLSLAFHKYGIEWTPDQIIFYYDDNPIRMQKTSVPNHAMKILFDLGFIHEYGLPGNNFPGFMYVDYVRAYKLQMDNCNNPQTITDFNSGTFNDYSLRKAITFYGTSLVLQNDNVTFRAQEGFEINGEFTVPLGSVLTLLPTKCHQ
ncbi:MAG: glycoside hydrolase family 16 protein [Bacteroidales bacterium]